MICHKCGVPSNERDEEVMLAAMEYICSQCFDAEPLRAALTPILAELLDIDAKTHPELFDIMKPALVGAWMSKSAWTCLNCGAQVQESDWVPVLSNAGRLDGYMCPICGLASPLEVEMSVRMRISNMKNEAEAQEAP